MLRTDVGTSVAGVPFHDHRVHVAELLEFGHARILAFTCEMHCGAIVAARPANDGETVEGVLHRSWHQLPSVEEARCNWSGESEVSAVWKRESRKLLTRRQYKDVPKASDTSQSQTDGWSTYGCPPCPPYLPHDSMMTVLYHRQHVRYTVLEQVGQGAYGIVCAAQDVCVPRDDVSCDGRHASKFINNEC